MKVLVYEHACGGGFAEGVVSSGILAEGFGMLRCCVAGLKAAGHEVLVVVDEGLARFNPPVEADFIPVFNFNDAQQAILKACVDVDAVYIIAPETGGTLHALVKLVEQNGVPTLNSHSSAIEAVSDKANLYRTLKINKPEVRTPKTVQVSTGCQCIKEVFRGEFGFPVVVKPVDGVGCSGLSLLENVSQFEDAVGKIVAELASETFMIQEFLEGEAVSVSLLCTDTQVLPISLNRQIVKLSTPKEASCYIGGDVPFCHEMQQEAFKAAKAVVSCFSGLKGYVGVDLILTATEPIVVDVNPRLTTSFIGYRHDTMGFNFADAIITAALKNRLPDSTVFSGRFTCFSKVETLKVDLDLLDILYGIPEVVSPPFPIQDSKGGCALISSEGNSLKEASLLLEEAKNHFLNITM